jgi:hypothetical protein
VIGHWSGPVRIRAGDFLVSVSRKAAANGDLLGHTPSNDPSSDIGIFCSDERMCGCIEWDVRLMYVHQAFSPAEVPDFSHGSIATVEALVRLLRAR